jgi:hypothetical protein
MDKNDICRSCYNESLFKGIINKICKLCFNNVNDDLPLLDYGSSDNNAAINPADDNAVHDDNDADDNDADDDIAVIYLGPSNYGWLYKQTKHFINKQHNIKDNT